jgi:hypothetical protein
MYCFIQKHIAYLFVYHGVRDWIRGFPKRPQCVTCHTLNRRMLCFLDINECASAPCRNGGSCSNNVNAYNCTCQKGYTGINCETGNNYNWLKIVFVLCISLFNILNRLVLGLSVGLFLVSMSTSDDFVLITVRGLGAKLDQLSFCKLFRSHKKLNIFLKMLTSWMKIYSFGVNLDWIW